MLKIFQSIEIEKKLVFYINFFLIISMILITFFEIKIKYFFYFLITITFIFSYIFFKKSRKLSKTIILTNLFIFFYFLYPYISKFLVEIFKEESYSFVLLYSLTIAYIFLTFSGNSKKLLGKINKFSFKLLSIIILIAIILGSLFYLVKEPVPFYFVQYSENFSWAIFLKYSILFSFLVAISEQMIFSGFLFNSYKELTSKSEAIFQTAILFVSFHLLRFEVLVTHYYTYFNQYYILYISGYYALLFIFMNLAIRLYSFSGKKYSGNFIYSVTLHFITDLTLFLFYALK